MDIVIRSVRMAAPVLLLWLLVACDRPGESTHTGEVTARTLAPDSCEAACDGQALAGACWCDADCEAYGDCCDDYRPVCVDPRPAGTPLRWDRQLGGAFPGEDPSGNWDLSYLPARLVDSHPACRRRDSRGAYWVVRIFVDAAREDRARDFRFVVEAPDRPISLRLSGPARFPGDPERGLHYFQDVWVSIACEAEDGLRYDRCDEDANARTSCGDHGRAYEYFIPR